MNSTSRFLRQSPSAISWWVPPGEVDWGRGFHLGSGDVWLSFSKLSLCEWALVLGVCLCFLFFFSVEQRDKCHSPFPSHTHILFLEMDQLQSTKQETAALAPNNPSPILYPALKKNEVNSLNCVCAPYPIA